MFPSKEKSMSLYQRIAENLQFVAPQFYKKRYFKNLKNITRENFSERNIEPELLWIKDYLKNDAVFLDIGANSGSFIFQLENKLSPKNIYAFEPNKNLFSRLKRIFPKTNIFPLALSDKNEIATFKVPIINGKKYNTRGTLQVDYREIDETKHHLQQVKVMKLDDWADQENLEKIDFIKIDVEGNEMQTLRGAKAVIEKFQPAMMVEMEQRHHSQPLHQLISEIENWGYETFFLDRKTFDLEKLDEKMISENTDGKVGTKQAYINNMIFIPKSHKTEKI